LKPIEGDLPMSTEKRKRFRGVLAAGAIAVGLAAGSSGVAAAANGTAASPPTGTTPQSAPATPDPQNPWGPQRSDETQLQGDTLASVKSAALDKVPGATIVRIETDADGHAAYEAHLIEKDGTPATVYVDKQFDVVGVEAR
jgi:hypothetical protein